MKRQFKITRMGAGLLAAALALGLACDSLEADDLNRPSIDSLTKNPTRAGVLAASTGLIIGHRAQVAQTNGYVSLLGILGRESYCFDKADPRFISEMLEAPSLDSSSPAFGGNEWQQPYANIRNAFIVLDALETVPVDPVKGITADEKLAITGFAKTIQALDFMIIHNTRWTEGGPIDVNRPLDAELAPLVTKDEILAHVVSLLDDAKAKLEAVPSGSDEFPFALSNGFVGFDRPSTFLRFNRGVRARVAVYQQDWPAAATALGESFLDDVISDPVGDLAVGVYHSYGTGSGDVTNALVSPNILAHPKLVTEAEAGDLRVARKIRTLPEAQTARGLTTDLAFNLYTLPTSRVPILRNEELILLRAETRFHQNDLPGANADIDLIRASAGLGPVTLDQNNFVDELLKQRRFSLMFEGGHRWIDLRRYDRLGDPGLKDLPTHNVHVLFPLPLAEQDARR